MSKSHLRKRLNIRNKNIITVLQLLWDFAKSQGGHGDTFSMVHLSCCLFFFFWLSLLLEGKTCKHTKTKYVTMSSSALPGMKKSSLGLFLLVTGLASLCLLGEKKYSVYS